MAILNVWKKILDFVYTPPRLLVSAMLTRILNFLVRCHNINGNIFFSDVVHSTCENAKHGLFTLSTL